MLWETQAGLHSSQARLGAGSPLAALTRPQERWRVSAEQSKAESTQRALEEQRRVKAQQMAMEREELERAKVSPATPCSAATPAVVPKGAHPSPSSQSALLEEQKAVMQKCGEERRRLAAEWADFLDQQRLSKERAEREAERAMQADTQREGTFVNLVKVGPGAATLPLPFPVLAVCSVGTGGLCKGHNSSIGVEATTTIQ